MRRRDCYAKKSEESWKIPLEKNDQDPIEWCVERRRLKIE
jgi:hypothetical protein